METQKRKKIKKKEHPKETNGDTTSQLCKFVFCFLQSPAIGIPELMSTEKLRRDRSLSCDLTIRTRRSSSDGTHVNEGALITHEPVLTTGGAGD